MLSLSVQNLIILAWNAVGQVKERDIADEASRDSVYNPEPCRNGFPAATLFINANPVGTASQPRRFILKFA